MRVLNNNVLVQLKEEKNEHPSGLIITMKSQEGPQQAVVIHSAKDDLIAGDVVLIQPDKGLPVKLHGTSYMMVNYNDILAVVE